MTTNSTDTPEHAAAAPGAPPGPAATAGPPKTPTPPSKLGYWIGGALAVLAPLAAVALGVSSVVGFANRVDDLQRVPIPGQGEVTLAEAGGYTVYYEADGVAESGEIPEATVSLARVEAGDDSAGVALESYDGSFTYDVSGHEGQAVLTFTVDEPGTYLLAASDVSEAGGTLAVGRSLTGGMGGRIALAGLVAVLGIAGGVLIVIVTALRRRRVRP